MKTMLLNWKCGKFVQLAIYAVRVIFPDAVLCGICGALYGLVFGGLGAQVRHEFSEILSVVSSSGIAGVVIGAIVAVLREVFGDQESASESFGKGDVKNQRVTSEVVIPFARISTTANLQNQKIVGARNALPLNRAISG